MTDLIFKGIRYPKDIIDWIAKKTKESGRTFSGEVVYQLRKLMRGKK